MNRVVTLLSTVSVLLALGAAPAAAQGPEILPVSALREGMVGIGRTVILGTAIEDFNVEIIGVMERGGFNGGPLILVRGWGPVLEKTGGFAGGYSGSPVYIDNKMIGAISAAWYFADGTIAGVTPIEEMLKNLSYPDSAPPDISPVPVANACLDADGTSIERVQIARGAAPTAEEVAAEALSGTMTLTPCRTPLFVNGLNAQLIEKLQTDLGPMLPYIDILPGIGSGAANGIDPTQLQLFHGLQPGAAVGAQLVAGDIDLTAIGTLTYIDENHVLAFGHPFLQAGSVELPLTKARIVHTMKSIQRSFKMGEATHRVGKIDQDRSAAVSGVLGTAPAMIPFHLTVKDLDIDRTKRYNYEVVDYEAILPLLGMLPPIQGLGEVMDRQGEATIKSTFRILTDELPPIERTNLFFDQFSGVGLYELFQSLYLLTSANIFEEIQIKEIFIDVEVTQDRLTTDIMKAEIQDADTHGHPPYDAEAGTALEPPTEQPTEPEPSPLQAEESVSFQMVETAAVSSNPGDEVPKFEPGDTIEVEVTLKPYRAESQTEVLKLTIPDDMQPGQTTLEIRGGGRLPSIFQYAQSAQFPQGFQSQGAPPMQTDPPMSLQDLLDLFLEQERMDELVLELYRIPLATTPTGEPILSSDNTMPSDARSSEEDESRREGVRNVDADSAASEDGTAKEEEPIKEVRAIGQVIFGSILLPVEIVDPNAETTDTDSDSDSSAYEGPISDDDADEDDSDSDEEREPERYGNRDRYR